MLAVIFERPDLYQISGQRVKGGAAEKARDGAKRHARTIFYAVFDQKGKLLESGPGAGMHQVPKEVLQKLDREIRTNRTVLDILKALETKATDKLAKPMVWTGYPRPQRFGDDFQTDEA